jgi:hypothetical protein
VWSAASAHISQRRAKRSAQEAARREQIAVELQKRATALQADAITFEYQKKLLDWADDVIGVINRSDRYLDRVTEGNVDTSEETDVAQTILGLENRGRLYFGNVFQDLVGADRPPGKRGYRPPILAAIAICYRVVREAIPENAKQCSYVIFMARQCFLDELKGYMKGGAQEFFKSRGEETDLDWEPLSHVVSEYERIGGVGSFWKDRPKSRSQLIAEKQA